MAALRVIGYVLLIYPQIAQMTQIEERA